MHVHRHQYGRQLVFIFKENRSIPSAVSNVSPDTSPEHAARGRDLDQAAYLLSRGAPGRPEHDWQGGPAHSHRSTSTGCRMLSPPKKQESDHERNRSNRE